MASSILQWLLPPILRSDVFSKFFCAEDIEVSILDETAPGTSMAIRAEAARQVCLQAKHHAEELEKRVAEAWENYARTRAIWVELRERSKSQEEALCGEKT